MISTTIIEKLLEFINHKYSINDLLGSLFFFFLMGWKAKGVLLVLMYGMYTHRYYVVLMYAT